MTPTAPKYRPLDRTRNEIRLLRILPPSSSGPATNLHFRSDIVRCEILYCSLDDIVATKRKAELWTKSVSPEDKHETAQSDITPSSLENNFSVCPTTYHQAVKESIGSERLALLHQLFHLQKNRLKNMRPLKTWNSELEKQMLKYWLSSWIWMPLAHAYGNETILAGYVALSYVWTQKPKISENLARQVKLYQTFKLTSPTCADIMAKAFSSVTQMPDEAEGSADIIVDGQCTAVGKNLESALRALREIPDIQAGMPVWVDALCINQNDVEERNVEVKRMNDIYANATRVITWLSETQNQHVEALEFMNTIGENLDYLMKIDKDKALALIDTCDLHTMVAYQALLSDLSYWNRAWIVQETVLASRFSIILCQRRRFYWTNIRHFVRGFNMRSSEDETHFDIMQRYGSGEGALGQKFLNFNLRLLCLHDAVVFRTLPESKRSYTDMSAWFGSLYFRLACRSNCRDPRDRVYSFLSLLPSSVANLIRPDYTPSKTLAQVMSDLAIAHIKATNSLEWLLYAIDLTPSVDPWPSWVPNVASPYKAVSIRWTGGHCARGRREIAEVAWGPEEICGVPVLRIKGFKLDVISGTGSNDPRDMDLLDPTFQPADNLDKLLENLQDYMRAQVRDVLPIVDPEFFVSLQKFVVSYFIEGIRSQGSQPCNITIQPKHRYGSNGGLQAALEKCMQTVGWELDPDCKDISSIFVVPREPLQKHRTPVTGRKTNNKGFTDFRRRNEKLDLWGRSLESFFDASTIQDNSVSPDSMLMLLKDGDRCTRGNLFTTAGGYLGANLCRILPGDEVYLFFGCRMPMALRKEEGGYRLVGPVYVCGAMDGTVMNELDANGTAPEEVIIL